MVRDVKGIADAFAEGRWGISRFIKTSASVADDGMWFDWSYTGGQPGYDARIGAAYSLTPFVAQRNDAIFLPTIPADMSLYLTGLNLYKTASGNDQISVNFMLYDLVAVYPLIDGDSTDLQAMTNDEALPRYADGAGLEMVLVNHVAPSAAAGSVHTLVYEDAAGVERTVTFSAHTGAVGRVCSRLHNPVGNLFGTLGEHASPFMGRAVGSAPGVRKVKSVQFSASLGGLWAIYIVKPLAQVTDMAGASGINQSVTTTTCFCIDGSFVLPKIEPGAWLGFFHQPQGGGRAVSSMYGVLTYCWG